MNKTLINRLVAVAWGAVALVFIPLAWPVSAAIALAFAFKAVRRRLGRTPTVTGREARIAGLESEAAALMAAASGRGLALSGDDAPEVASNNQAFLIEDLDRMGSNLLVDPYFDNPSAYDNFR